jgi:hypothetical protein
MEDEKDLGLDENNDSLNVDEVVEADEADTDTPTVEDYIALKQKNKELYERAKKAEAVAKAKKEALPNKPNEPQTGLSREEAILYAKGYTDDEVALANKIAKVEGVSPLVAIEDEIFKGKVDARKKKERSEKAALPASGGLGKYKPEKPTGEMTPEEHKAYFDRVMGN